MDLDLGIDVSLVEVLALVGCIQRVGLVLRHRHHRIIRWSGWGDVELLGERGTLNTQLVVIAHHSSRKFANVGGRSLCRRNRARRAIRHVGLVQQCDDVRIGPSARGGRRCHSIRRRISRNGARRCCGSVSAVVLLLFACGDGKHRDRQHRHSRSRSVDQHRNLLPPHPRGQENRSVIGRQFRFARVCQAKSVRTAAFSRLRSCTSGDSCNTLVSSRPGSLMAEVESGQIVGHGVVFNSLSTLLAMHSRLVCVVTLIPSAIFAQQRTTPPALRPITFLDRQLQRDVGSPTPSPDGKWLLYKLSTPDWSQAKRQTDVYLVSVRDGVSSSRQMTFTKDKNETSSRWSRDGKFFVFLSNRDAPSVPSTGGSGTSGSGTTQNQIY